MLTIKIITHRGTEFHFEDAKSDSHWSILNYSSSSRTGTEATEDFLKSIRYICKELRVIDGANND